MYKKYTTMNKEQRKNLLEIMEEMRNDLRKTICNDKISRETGDILLRPLEENFGDTAIRCNYCILKAEQRCALIYFGLDFRYKCCPQHKLPVDLKR